MLKGKIFEKKRIVSILLALCMVLALLPGTARAEEPEQAEVPPAITYEENGNTNSFTEDTTNKGIAGTASFNPLNGQILLEYEPTFKVYDSAEGGEENQTITCTITHGEHDGVNYTNIRIEFTFTEKPEAAENKYYVATVSKDKVESATRAELIVYVDDDTGSDPEPVSPAAPEITATGTASIITVTLKNATFDATEAVKTSNWFVGLNYRIEVSKVELNADRTTATLTLATAIPGNRTIISTTTSVIADFDGKDNYINCDATITSVGDDIIGTDTDPIPLPPAFFPDISNVPSTPATPFNSSSTTTSEPEETPEAPEESPQPETPAAPETPSLPAPVYTDVAPAAWYNEAASYVSAYGLMTGTSAAEFSPAANMTRAMVWTVLGRLDGADVSGSGSAWYDNAQTWSKSKGISDGSNPNGSVTREELATMLWRYMDSPTASADLGRFGDSASVSGAVQWAVSAGLLEGSDGNLNPSDTATRAEVAAILMRFCENVVK